MNYKQILPIEWNYAIKHAREWIKSQRPQIDNEDIHSEKRVFFLDAPAYGNLGDQAIVFAMEKFVGDVLPDYSQIEITEDRLPESISWLKREIRNNDLICLTGGGNMGVMYQRYESVRRLVLKNFPQNPIVIFPQTFCYGDSAYSRREKKRAKLLYSRVENLVLCARDETSFEDMKENFPKAKVIFCPDIVLYLDYFKKYEKEDKIGICLRSDGESAISEECKNGIFQRFPQYISLSTMDSSTYFTRQNRQCIVEKKLQEFGTKNLVITDRLHGMIFSYITNTPCVALPNSNGKVERVSLYLKKNGNISFANDGSISITGSFKENRSLKACFQELEDIFKSIAHCTDVDDLVEHCKVNCKIGDELDEDRMLNSMP